ncbi:MAG: hypothetical protein R3Y47_06085 [Lachnospiraceae bacterium]
MNTLEKNLILDTLMTDDECFEAYVEQEVARTNLLKEMLVKRKDLRTRYQSMEFAVFVKEQKKLQQEQEVLLEKLIL